MNLYIETFLIAIITAIIGLIISTLFMLPQKDFTFQKYTFWPQILLSFFITGFIVHLAYKKFI